jgi:primosomal protein N''
VYARATWEARALFLAEQLAIDPPSTKPPTPDEWRERDLRRRDVASEDFMSRAEQRLAREQEFEARLREKFPHLSADQINTEITKYRQEVLSKEDDHGTSSNGHTYRQV